MKNSKTIGLACLFAAGIAAAQTQTVEDRKAVMDAQIELVKKQKELQDALRGMAGASATGMPVVVSVTISSERIARLLLPNGIVGHYREGEAVRSGMVVSAIAPKQVFVAVSNGKGKTMTAIALEFAGPVVQRGVPGLIQANVPDALLPDAPDVKVPPIEAIPDAKPTAPKATLPAASPVLKAGK